MRKLELYREGGSSKRLRDVRAMLAFSPERIDPPYGPPAARRRVCCELGTQPY